MRAIGTTLAPGLRRLSPAILATDDIAAQFSGISPDLSCSQVLATFKRAAPYLGITPRLVHFIDLLMSWSQDLDWRDDARPIVWPSNRLLQDELALGRTQVKSLIRCSIEFGLINPVESPNGKRYGHRDARGRIVQAFGFDLSPLAVRLDEFATAADAARADREARKALRRRLTIACKAVLQLAETGHQYEVAGDDWAALVETAQDIAAVGRQAETLTELRAAVESLERYQQAAESVIKEAFSSVSNGPREPESRPHITTTKQPPSDYKSDTTVSESRRRSPDQQDPSLQKRTKSKAWQAKPPCRGDRSRSESSESEEPFDKPEIGIRPDHLVEISPKLDVYLGRDEPTWPNLIEAAFLLRHELGISQHAWADACRRMGRPMTAACVALIDGKREGIASPGGYLRAMTSRFDAGELNLARSFYGLRQSGRRVS